MTTKQTLLVTDLLRVIGGEIVDGTTEEDRDMDLPLQYQRWIARMTKQGKAKQADV